MVMNNNDLQIKLDSLDYKYKLVIRTDRVDFEDSIADTSNVLEIRAFDEKGEFRAYRSVVGADFRCREILGDADYADGFYKTSHYLDIDSTKSSGTKVRTTGGGSFTLPVEGAEKLIVIRYYKFDSDGSGIARDCDWRLAGFLKKGERTDGKA